METRNVVDLLPLLKRFAFVLLFAYFCSRVIGSVEKLREQAVGTSSKLVISNEVPFPSLTICPMILRPTGRLNVSI